MPIDLFMDIEEQCLAFVTGDASLKDTSGAASIQFIVVNPLPFGPACDVPGFDFVV
jgi:hypothetical protein